MIRKLRHETTKVLALVEKGECVEVRRHGKLVAVLHPPERREPRKRPGFAGRLADVYRETVMTKNGTELMNELRGDS